MIVWVWDASGPDIAMSGVSDTRESAQKAADYCIEHSGATFASTEMATLVLGAEFTHYRHSGLGWTASRNKQTGAVIWIPFTAEDAKSS